MTRATVKIKKNKSSQSLPVLRRCHKCGRLQHYFRAQYKIKKVIVFFSQNLYSIRLLKRLIRLLFKSLFKKIMLIVNNYELLTFVVFYPWPYGIRTFIRTPTLLGIRKYSLYVLWGLWHIWLNTTTATNIKYQEIHSQKIYSLTMIEIKKENASTNKKLKHQAMIKINWTWKNLAQVITYKGVYIFSRKKFRPIIFKCLSCAI
jgi:hypothetical protein